MTTVLILFTIIGLLGAFDTLYHHEFKERLPWRPEVKDELVVHATRNFFYFVLFLSLAWIEWHGVLAWLFLAMLVTEIFVTFWDFALEGKVRDVPAPEIIVHALLGIVYGATLAFLVPIVFIWSEQNSGFSFVEHGIFSPIMTAYALSVLVFAFRDYFRSQEVENFKQIYVMNLEEKEQNILVTGGSGFIGSKVSQALIDDGHRVTVLTRDFNKTIKKFSKQVTLVERLDEVNQDFDVILNFAGESINQKWTEASKKAILQSRVEVTNSVLDYIKRIEKKPRLLISSSGTGIYPTSETEVFTELSDLETKGFLAKVCQQWESIAKEAENYGVRVVPLRTGLVLGIDGGVLAEMLTPFDLCLGGKLGDGKQIMPWIDMHDMLGIVEKVINDENIKEAVNATAPKSVSNEVFSKALAKGLHRPAFLTTQPFMLNALFGKEMTADILLSGRAVLPLKIEEAGYVFKFKTIESSMNNLFNKG